MEIVKNKRVNVIVFLLSLILLGAASCAFGQEKMELLRDNSTNKFTTLFPSYTMFFETKSNDTLFIGIKADSINKRVVSPNLYAFIPESYLRNHKFMVVGFEDGTVENFPVVFVSRADGYVEYNFSTTAYTSLKNKKMTYVGFDAKSKFNSDDYISYFIDFLKLL